MKAPLDSNQKAITKKIRALVPDATAIIFFGSRVRGMPAPTSDYDVLVFTPTGMESDERVKIEEKLGDAFPDLTIDPVFGTERWLLAHLYMEPYYRFWLENSVAGYGQVPHVEEYPLLHRGALKSRLRIIRAEVNVIRALSQTLYSEGCGYLNILSKLILIEHALAGDYRNEFLWADVEAAVGKQVFQILRNRGQRHRIRKPMVERLHRMVLRKIGMLRRQLENANLADQLPWSKSKHGEPQR